MKSVSMSGSPRENVGKKDAKALRAKGLVPCVLYGGEDQVHFAVEEKQFKKLIFTPEVQLVKLSVGKKEYEASLQDVQYHPVTDHILHVDFLEIKADKPIIIGVPLKTTGNSKGVIQGGKLFKKVRKLKVRGLPKDLPDHITVDITDLEIGQTMKVSDVHVSNLELLDLPTSVILGVRTTRGVEAGPAAAEPEK